MINAVDNSAAVLTTEDSRLFRRTHEYAAVAASIDDGSPTRVILELDGLRRLVPNWDGQGAHVPTQESVDSAKNAFQMLVATGKSIGVLVPSPRVLAGGDGAVGLYWQHEKGWADLELAFDPSGFEVLASERGEALASPPSPNAYDVLALMQRLILSS